MVRGPMKIFSPRRMALRTSVSLTNSTDFGGGADAGEEGAAGAVAQAAGDAADAGREPKMAETAAEATSLGVGRGFVAGAGLASGEEGAARSGCAKAEPRGMPNWPMTRSTILEMV